MKRLVPITVVIIAALALSPGNAVAATWYVSATGSDLNACTQAAPCLSFNRAYQVALAGDTVLVASGTYANQTINRNPNVTGADSQEPNGSEVTFKPLSGPGTVTVQGINLSTLRGPTVEKVAIEDMTFSTTTFLRSCRNCYLVRTIHTSPLFINWGSFVAFLDGEVGPCPTCTDGIDIFHVDNIGGTDILIQGMRIHGIRTNDPLGHPDAIQIFGATTGVYNNLKFIKNKFWDNEGINFRHTGGGDTFTNIVFENNFFGATVSGLTPTFFNIQPAGDNTIFRYNTVDGTVQPAGAGEQDGMLWEGNIIKNWGSNQCPTGTGTISRYNVWGPTMPQCGSTNFVVSDWASIGFVNPSPSVGDLHLTAGSPAIDRGNPASYPATDIDRETRFMGSAPDAGAHETSGALGTQPPAAPTSLRVL